MTMKGGQMPPANHIPKPYRPIVTTAGEQATIWRDRYASNRTGMTAQGG
jgi:hypothetical protein